MRQAHQIVNRYWYPFHTRFLSNDDRVFMNWGYEEDPPMALPLAESDEPDRYSIQLYHRTAAQADLTGKRVLEVSCGHGGGASYVMRALGPASYTGLDLNPVGLDFCRKKHQLPGLDFVHGSAEELPFDDQSFDAVINIEASHCYARFPRFLAEVARVLRPGGYFLYADVRKNRDITEWEKDLADAPLRLISNSVINEEVARGVEKIHLSQFRGQRRILPSCGSWLWTHFHRALQNNETSYRTYCFAKA
ncbi:phthiotriol/phenolphthiotriol dimycocerosates methyltransferase [Mycobacterium sp. E796]|uniref:phthiotriol/phenolphthiotriol dimycocerosates methyltransferase n=1 Tax=Mycobacterium sp. E796 TaxID=1834151 RepID=UPI0007FBE594|nr:class I SAM-dependent methyltransferase [Mycobacterium sp. E796]OBI58292.1 SAM-dependent methyltransferase [Mycobacterium sp. E796]